MDRSRPLRDMMSPDACVLPGQEFMEHHTNEKTGESRPLSLVEKRISNPRVLGPRGSRREGRAAGCRGASPWLHHISEAVPIVPRACDASVPQSAGRRWDEAWTSVEGGLCSRPSNTNWRGSILNPLSAKLISSLKLDTAVVKEATSVRNLVPAEPGWDRLAARSKQFAEYVSGLLKSGYHPGGQRELLARKPGQGVRPVGMWGPVERVVYRALAAVALAPFPPLDRSPDRYLAFVTAPVKRGIELQSEAASKEDIQGTRRFFFTRSPLKYVVKSDIISFYQFIDHGILSDELLLHGANYEAVDALVSFLGAMQGRVYGIPQLLDASDWLSEIYIERVHRELVRDGLEVWRFNDDFLVATRTYEDALHAVESLDAAARRAGLVVSEHKTVTYGFSRYMIESLNLRPIEGLETIDPAEVEEIVGDYTDEFEGDDAALEQVQAVDLDPSEGGINVREARIDQIRLLRRALGVLTRDQDPRALPQMLELLIYIPSLTPSLCRYLIAVNESAPRQIVEVLDEALKTASLNDWQRVWLLSVITEVDLLLPHSGGDDRMRLEWVRSLRLNTRDDIVRCWCSRALSRAGALPLREVVADADVAPSALLLPYADAIVRAVQQPDDTPVGKVVSAWASQSALHKFLGASSADSV